MASFPKDSGKYHRVIFRKTYDGEQRSKTFYFRKDEFTRTEVSDWKKRKELAFKGGDWMPWDKDTRITKDSDITIQEAVEKYRSVAKQQLAEETLRTRFSDLDLLAEYVGERRYLSKIPKDLYNSFINRSGTYGTKKRRKSSLRNFLQYLSDEGEIDERPTLDVRSTRAERNKSKSSYKAYVEPDEFDAVKEAAKVIHKENLASKAGKSPKYQKYRDFEQEFPHIFDFLIHTAIRRSDLLNLHTSWFSDDNKFMTIGDDDYLPKSQQIERIPLTPRAQQIAARWIEQYGDVRPFGNITRDWYTKFFKRIFKEALQGKAAKLSAHKMRDSAVMFLLHEMNLSPQTVQQITRHKQLSTLMVYAHRSPESALREIEQKSQL